MTAPARQAAGPTRTFAPLVVFDRTASTSTLLLAWAARVPALPAGTTVVARAQTAARGSRGRAWVSPPGNFAASVLLRPGGAVRDAGRLALVAAVALTDVLRPMLPQARVKWPNDVTVDGAKLAGILIDTITDGPALAGAVVGVGVNVFAHPDIPGRPACDLRSLGVPAPDPVALAAGLRDGLRARANQDFPAIAEIWMARAAPAGTPIRVLVGGRVLHGHFQGLSPDGHLLLRDGATTHSIVAGEVLLPGG